MNLQEGRAWVADLRWSPPSRSPRGAGTARASASCGHSLRWRQTEDCAMPCATLRGTRPRSRPAAASRRPRTRHEPYPRAAAGCDVDRRARRGGRTPFRRTPAQTGRRPGTSGGSNSLPSCRGRESCDGRPPRGPCPASPSRQSWAARANGGEARTALERGSACRARSKWSHRHTWWVRSDPQLTFPERLAIRKERSILAYGIDQRPPIFSNSWLSSSCLRWSQSQSQSPRSLQISSH